MDARQLGDRSNHSYEGPDYPASTLRPSTLSPSIMPSQMTVVFVLSDDPQRQSRVLQPEDYTPGHELNAIETETSGNKKLRVFTNNPWAIVDKSVCATLEDVNFFAQDPSYNGAEAHLDRIVETSKTLDGWDSSSRYIMASQEQVDRWLENHSVIEMHKARTHLPFEVQQALSAKPTITIGADKTGIRICTNGLVRDLSTPENASLVQHLKASLSEASRYSTSGSQGLLEDYYGRAADRLVAGKPSQSETSFNLYRNDNPTCDAFAGRHCRGIKEIGHNSIRTLTSQPTLKPELEETLPQPQSKWSKLRSRVSRHGGPSKSSQG